MTAQFAHVALNCKDLAAIEGFYTRHFGFRRARVIDLGATQIIFIKLGDFYLELFQAEGTSPAAAPQKDGYGWSGVRHIALKVENVDDVLASLGTEATVALGPMSFDDFIPGWRTAWVKDPEGNILEISQGFVDQVNPPAFGLEPALAH